LVFFHIAPMNSSLMNCYAPLGQYFLHYARIIMGREYDAPEYHGWIVTHPY